MKEIPDREGRPEARVGPEIKVRMGQQLRVMYSDVMNQGVPDHHSELLRRLDAPDQTAGA
jgi:Anti-sigma factor NepR